MDKFLGFYFAIQARMAGITRDQRGQGTLEYVGMIIVAAIIIVAVLDATKTIDLGSIFSNNVKKVTDRG